MRTAPAAVAALMLTLAGAAGADEVTLVPVADATLYEDFFGDTANGLGEAFFIGTNNSGGVYRTVLRFDLSAIPAGATIDTASLTLFCNRTIAGPEDATMHRLLADWTEGPSVPSGNGGAPAPAEAGDVTWVYRSFVPPGPGSPEWTNRGGDFDPAVSGSAVIGGEFNFFTFTGDGLADDLQAWIDGNADNFGWIIIGRETGTRSSKRFDSKDGVTPSLRPMLTVTYSTGGGCTAADLAQPFGVLDLADLQAFVAGFLANDPIADLAAPAGVFDLADLQAFVASFNGGCP